MNAPATVSSRQMSAKGLAYELFDFFQLRAPAFPVEFYRNLSLSDGPHSPIWNLLHGHELTSAARGDRPEISPEGPSAEDQVARAAIAVASLSLLDAAEKSAPHAEPSKRVRSRLYRYLVRMSTRCTPFGMFAGVALGSWAKSTDLHVGSQLQTRTRPDMEWLMQFVWQLESVPGIRRHLNVFANPAISRHSGRLFLAERAVQAKPRDTEAVSIRETRLVHLLLKKTRVPIRWDVLAEEILAEGKSGTQEKVEQLLCDLWEQTFLLTDLRPPLTSPDPAAYVLERLSRLEAARDDVEKLRSILDGMKRWDNQPSEQTVDNFRRIACAMAECIPVAPRSPIQVDSAHRLTSCRLSREVGMEVARAAELLLRTTPWPDGPAYLHQYQEAFRRRYGDRVVPVLELLDPAFGLGPPSAYLNQGGFAPSVAQQKHSSTASQLLLDLAFHAIRENRQSVHLDENLLQQFQNSSLSVETLPLSLDVYATVAARSPEAIDEGNFRVVIGPNVGASAAGRNLGRFADLLGSEAREALGRVAEAEEAVYSDRIWAELVYLPRYPRSANVVIRPPVRQFEIVWGTSPGVGASQAIPVNELQVRVRDGRLRLSWGANGLDVNVCMGHMLNYTRAPVVCRFLADVGRQGVAQLSGFWWGPATQFPFLPRVESGRVILRSAQWNLHSATLNREFQPRQPKVFFDAFERWRERWNPPRFVYLAEHDNRLLLDLDSEIDQDELRRSAITVPTSGRLILEEACPGLDEAWAEGERGRYMTEIVVSLIRHSDGQASTVPRSTACAASQAPAYAEWPSELPAVQEQESRLRPPGSDWLFLKLYCHAHTLENLILGPIREFTSEVKEADLCLDSFWMRYADPDPHVRVRFTGDCERLTQELLPRTCKWASSLMACGKCIRFAVDTYDRELERYGGPEGTALAESLFCHDSHCITDLLSVVKPNSGDLDRRILALLSLRSLLRGFGLDAKGRAEWCRTRTTSRKAGSTEFSARKTTLRSALGDPVWLRSQTGGTRVAEILTRYETNIYRISSKLRKLAQTQRVMCSLDSLLASFCHMHLNRMGRGSDERLLIALLWRVEESLVHSPPRTVC